MAGFTLPGRKTILGLAAAGLVLAGTMGTALADENTVTGAASRYQQFTERLATVLGKQPDELRSAITQVHSQYIDEAVAAGKIPADKAQEMKDRTAQGGVPFMGGPGKGHGPGHAGMPGHTGKPDHAGMLMGEVVRVEGQTITVKTPDGSEKTALLTATTEVRKGRETADAAAIIAGARIGVHGQTDAQGIVTAAKVQVHDGQMGQPGDRHGGPRRGHGPAGQPPTSGS